MPDFSAPSTNISDNGNRMPVKHVMVMILGFLAGIIGIYALHLFRNRQRALHASEFSIESEKADPEIVNLSADELPPDQWIALSSRFMSEGSLRLALRALYLGTLAWLGEKDMISIAMHKSNRDYKLELQRRAHDRKEIQEMFSVQVTSFDRYWYGMNNLDRRDVDRFAAAQNKMMASLVKTSKPPPEIPEKRSVGINHPPPS